MSCDAIDKIVRRMNATNTKTTSPRLYQVFKTNTNTLYSLHEDETQFFYWIRDPFVSHAKSVRNKYKIKSVCASNGVKTDDSETRASRTNLSDVPGRSLVPGKPHVIVTR